MADSREKAPEAPGPSPSHAEAATAVAPHQPAEEPSKAVPAPTPAHDEAEDVPDPDEDDLDDLDDMLDEFSASHSVPAPSSSGPGRPPTAGSDFKAPAELSPEEFAAELQREMSSLMGEIDESPEMRGQLDAMMKELAKGAEGEPVCAPGPASATAGMADAATSKAKATAADDSFQETIRKTMERMQASGEQASAAASQGGSEQDMLEKLLKEIAAGGGGEGGEGGEDDFSKMMLGMMVHLTNKEILYEPMKDLKKTFPPWMEANKETTAKEDFERYEAQQRIVGEVVARFEREGYSDDNPADREFIMESMQKMQASGVPPPDLVDDMQATQDALGELDQGCAQQ